MKILTISIAAYNIEKFISKAIESVIEPSVIDKLEVLIENDGSNDKTEEIARKYMDKYPESIKVITKANGGYGSTINNSIKLATGRYFKQLDGDDMFLTTNLPDFISLLESCDADYVMTPFIEFYEGTDHSRIKNPFAGHSNGQYDFDKYEIYENISMHSLCIRTDVLKKMYRQLDTHCLYTDIEFCTYPVINAKSYYIYDKPIYLYRLGDDGQSVSKGSIVRHLDDFMKVLTNVLNFYQTISSDLNGQKRFVMAHAATQLGLGMRYLCYFKYSIKNGKRLKQYIKKMKENYPEIFRESVRRSRFVRALVYSDCLLYPIARLWANR